MAKNINLQNITNETLGILSGWNYAFMNGQELRKTAKQAVEKAQEEVNKINQLRAEAVAQGKTTQEAVSAFSRLEADNKLNKAEEEYKKVCGDLREQANRAKKLVPDGVYEAYQNRAQNKSGYTRKIAEFLAEMGISGTDRACEKVADALAQCLNTCKKATGKAKKSGRKIQYLAKVAYQDLFIAAFIDYAVCVKGCLTEEQDGVLTLTVYEQETETEKTAE